MSSSSTLLAVCCALAALGVQVALAAPQFSSAPQFAAAPSLASYRSAPAISRTEQHDDAGQYSLSYQTHEGISVNERGVLKQTPDGLDNVLVKEGNYQYVSPDGTPVQVTYSADEYGFHPQSPNIPVAPAAPTQQRF